MQQEFHARKVNLPVREPSQLTSWLVSAGDTIRKGNVLCKYQLTAGGAVMSLKAPCVGVIKQLLVEESVTVQPGTMILVIEERCPHSIVVHDMCADCGVNLRKYEIQYVGSYGELTQPVTAQVSMIHSIPGIRVSQEEAEQLARQDQLRLLKERKLALIVDLDQTLIHTAISPGIEKGLPDVYKFTLREHPHITYHTRLRPYCREFLQKVSKLYELHISTMGCRSYADKIAGIIDPKKCYFSSRVISRDECIDPTSKALRLRSVFPCGDRMVAIIDDREDVWGRAPNLVHVKPYMFFSGVADINAPPVNSKPDPSETSSSAPDESTNSSEVKEPNKSIDTEDTRAPEADNDGEIFVDSQESQSNVVALSQSTESDKEGSVQSDSSSSGDSEGSSSSSGVSSVNSTDGLSQEAEPTDTQLDVPVSMTATANASVNPNSLTEQDANKTEVSSPKPIPDVASDSKQPSEVEVSSEQPAKETRPHGSVSRVNRLPSDIQDPDNFLIHLATILTKVHKIFYAEYDCSNTRQQNVIASSHINTPDLKEIIPRLRNSVLQDCRILFTGVIPTNALPERCPEWNTARAFGATIHTTLVGNCDSTHQPTTHLIVGKIGTSKLHEAKRMPGVKIVNCSWLWASAESWERADEAVHRLKETKLLQREEKHPSWQNKPTSQVRAERTSSVSVPLISDKELVEMDQEVDAELDEIDSDSSVSDTELDTKDSTLETIDIPEGSRKRKLSESPQSLSTSSDIAKSSDEDNDDDDDELGALLEAQISSS